MEICNFSVSLAQPTLLPISSSTPTNNFKLGHATVLIWQLKKIFIILVITSTLLESSRFHVLKYIKASINPKVFTNFTFFQENSTLSPMTQASWFLIECQYLLTLIFEQGQISNYLVTSSIILVITSFDAGNYQYDAEIYQWCAGSPQFAHTDYVDELSLLSSD